MTFLIDSREACSSLAFHAPCVQLSSDSLLVSGVKADGFHVPLFREAPIRCEDRQKKESFSLSLKQEPISET
jgi:hypothetical protein